MDTIGDYVFDKSPIGKGAFALVYKGFKKQDPRTSVAIKSIEKKNLNKTKDMLDKEIKVLKELSVCQHENLVAFLDIRETDTNVYLVLEYCNGGDLAGYLLKKGTLSEEALSSFMQQIASALNALYNKGILHRDIKPQNILLSVAKGGDSLTTPPSHITFKLGDFGFARFLQDGMMAGTMCGSPMYMAPEVIMSQKYDAKADMWSVGFIVFQCLTGKVPFFATSPPELRMFYERNVDLRPKVPESTSEDLANMLTRLLTRDPTKRIGIKELMEHQFLKRFRRSPSRRGYSSSPIPARHQTPSLSSESSSPGSNREISPLARQVGEVGDMMNTLTGSNEEDSGFTKVEKPDTRPHTPDDFVLVPEGLPEYNSSGERRGKGDRAPLALAEEEYDAFDSSLSSSLQPVRMHTNDGKVVFRKDDHHRSPNASRLSSPMSPSPSPPLTHRSGGSSAPIPVPSLSRMSGVGQRDGGSGKSGSPARVKKRSASSGSGDRSGDRLSGRRNSETALAAPDITQVSPPAVQFNIGTPPSTGTWKRTNNLGSGGSTARMDAIAPTPTPILASSPLRRSASCSPGSCFTPHTPYTTPPTSLPTVTGPTTRHCPYHYHHTHQHQHPFHQQQHHHHHYPVHDPYAYHDTKFHRYPTVPDCTALVAYTAPEECGLEPCHRCGTEPDLRSQPFSANHILRAAFPTHQQTTALTGLGALVPWSDSQERLTSMGNDKDRASPCSMDQERTTPIMPRRNSLMGDVSSPSTLMFAASPPILDTAPCVPQELSEDTLMDDEHNETMARLRFILDVVDCVVTLARSKGAAYNPMADSLSVRTRGDSLPQLSMQTGVSESQRLVEQLVLYLRALQMIAQSISLAQKEMKMDRLQYVSSLKKVLNQQNELYMYCIEECRKLYEQLGTVCKTPLTPQLIVNTADKLIYSYAVEQCQGAALDELEGNTKECFQRYTTAQILLHSLAQLAHNKQDQKLLERYRRSVELRLSSIGGQGVQRACPTWS